MVNVAKKMDFLVLLPLLLLSVDSATVCPPDMSIFPCACVENNTPLDVSLYCLGDSITQDSINQLMSAVAITNNVSFNTTENVTMGEGKPYVHHLAIAGTNLTVLDLTPFLGWSFNQFYIYRNQRLTSFTKDAGNSSVPSDGITGIDIHVDTNSLDDEAVNQFLDALENQEFVKKLILRENRIRGKDLSSFDDFSGLNELDMSYNYIRKIGGGQFKKLTQLETLDLQGNYINEIGKDAFLFEKSGSFEKLLVIYLDGNKLSNSGFNKNHGLDSIERDTKVYLRNNNFQFISEENFGSFILAPNQANILKFWGNMFFCDKKTAWVRNLKKGDVSLQNFVFSVDCQNDEGKNIFNTVLLD